MAGPKHPVWAAFLDLAWKFTRRNPATVGAVGGTFFVSSTVAHYAGWTVGFVALMTVLSYPAKRIVATQVWMRRYRLLLAGDSLRWPGRKAARVFRRLEARRKDNVRKQWAAVCASNGLVNAAKQVPALRHLRSLSDGSLTCEIAPGPMAMKGGLRAIMARRDEIAEICGADGGLRIRPYGSSMNSVAPGKARLTFFFEKQTWPVLPIQELPPSAPDRVSLGNDEDLKAAHMPLVLSLLLVGMTGKGKSRTIWTLLVGIATKARHRLFVVDPKGGQEMGPLAPLTSRGYVGNRKVEAYAKDSEEGAYGVILAAEAAMVEQQELLAAEGIAEWKPEYADRFPLVVLAMDEVLTFLSKITAANKPGKAAEAALVHMLSEGRAAGVKVIMASQASDKEILGNNRTLIPGRLVLGTENPMQTAMAFGDSKAEEHGALCSEIDEPGIAYLKIDGVRGYRKVRVASVERDDVADYVETGLPRDMGVVVKESEAWRPGWVYRYLVKDNCFIEGRYYFAGQLLYVGETTSPPDRHKQHIKDFLEGDPKHYWMKWVDLDAPPLVTWAESKTEAVRIQNLEIAQYGPFGNVVMNGGTPWRGKDPVSVPAEQVQKSFLQRFQRPLKARSLQVRPPVKAEPSEGPVTIWPLPADRPLVVNGDRR